MIARECIGDFWLTTADGHGWHYRIYAAADATVRVGRVHPDPDSGRDVVEASGLDTDSPSFAFRSNWAEPERRQAESAIRSAWQRWTAEGRSA